MRPYSVACVTNSPSSFTQGGCYITSDQKFELTRVSTPQDVVLICKQNGYGPSALIIRSLDGSEAAFIKYGRSLAMGEARAHNYIADHVNSDKDVNCASASH